ncbi:hypothetical protein AB5I41_08115 [Sphingomonas sp. MMS24-JH45]
MFINGTDDGETLNGTPDGDIITGFDGQDTINGLGGNDTIELRRSTDEHLRRLGRTQARRGGCGRW